MASWIPPQIEAQSVFFCFNNYVYWMEGNWESFLKLIVCKPLTQPENGFFLLVTFLRCLLLFIFYFILLLFFKPSRVMCLPGISSHVCYGMGGFFLLKTDQTWVAQDVLPTWLLFYQNTHLFLWKRPLSWFKKSFQLTPRWHKFALGAATPQMCVTPPCSSAFGLSFPALFWKVTLLFSGYFPFPH